MGNKTISTASTVILELLHFVTIVICWLIIWSISGLSLFSWQGMIFFIAILILMFIVKTKDLLDKLITEKYENN